MMFHDSSLRRPKQQVAKSPIQGHDSLMAAPSSTRIPTTRMIVSSSLRPEVVVSPHLINKTAPSAVGPDAVPPPPPLSNTNQAILFHSNITLDLDICDLCYLRMSDTMKQHIPIMEAIYSWDQRRRLDRGIVSIHCDICGISIACSGGDTKATVATALRPSMRDLQNIALACQGFPWNGTSSELRLALQLGGYGEVEAERLTQLLLHATRNH